MSRERVETAWAARKKSDSAPVRLPPQARWRWKAFPARNKAGHSVHLRDRLLRRATASTSPIRPKTDGQFRVFVPAKIIVGVASEHLHELVGGHAQIERSNQLVEPAFRSLLLDPQCDLAVVGDGKLDLRSWFEAEMISYSFGNCNLALLGHPRDGSIFPPQVLHARGAANL